jgi:hypothetical protein
MALPDRRVSRAFRLQFLRRERRRPARLTLMFRRRGIADCVLQYQSLFSDWGLTGVRNTDHVVSTGVGARRRCRFGRDGLGRAVRSEDRRIRR